MENIWMFLQQTAAGGLCALFLLLLQRIFRNLLSPRWQYGIWGVLVLRLLIPAGVWAVHRSGCVALAGGGPGGD